MCQNYFVFYAECVFWILLCKEFYIKCGLEIYESVGEQRFYTSKVVTGQFLCQFCPEIGSVDVQVHIWLA